MEGGFSNRRFVLKPDVAITSEVSILSRNSLAITDFHAKKAQHVQLFENPLPGTPPIRDSQIITGPTFIFGELLPGYYSPQLQDRHFRESILITVTGWKKERCNHHVGWP